MRTAPWSTPAMLVLAGVCALSLAACSSDTPSGPAANPATSTPQTFAVTSASVSSARAASVKTTKLFYTIPILESKQSSMSRRGLRETITQSPFDMTNHGGPVVTHATNWNVYVNCPQGPAACWGTGNLTPATFLRDFDRSSMIEIMGQYLNEDPTGRFRQVNELATMVTFPVDTTDGTPTASLQNIFQIVFAAASFTKKSGYDHIYHIFLPQGTDMCQAPGVCYSPDNLPTEVFCAFHGSVDFGPNFHVLYSVEPYQFVPGICTLQNQTRVIDGTASTLSHEFSETISDPDGDAWFNNLTASEIGDLCFVFRNPEQVAGHQYVIQEEYSNTVNACTDGAF
jgi:hypothetical protein